MPNPPSWPTVVKVGVFVADIIDLDEVDESFQAEFIIVAEWDAKGYPQPILVEPPALIEEGGQLTLLKCVTMQRWTMPSTRPMASGRLANKMRKG